jgi:hypothetical protein
LTEAELIAHVLRLSEVEPYVIREYVTNHSAIADLCPGALSTLRVLTCCDEHGRPEVTHAVLRMASNRDVVVDNFHAWRRGSPRRHTKVGGLAVLRTWG